VAGHVDVRVVPVRRLVLDVRDGDGDAPGGLLRRLVDALERDVPVGCRVAVGEDLRDGGGQGRLAGDLGMRHSCQSKHFDWIAAFLLFKAAFHARI
jgi:hypothetical protein